MKIVLYILITAGCLVGNFTVQSIAWNAWTRAHPWQPLPWPIVIGFLVFFLSLGIYLWSLV